MRGSLDAVVYNVNTIERKKKKKKKECETLLVIKHRYSSHDCKFFDLGFTISRLTKRRAMCALEAAQTEGDCSNGNGGIVTRRTKHLSLAKYQLGKSHDRCSKLLRLPK